MQPSFFNELAIAEEIFLSSLSQGPEALEAFDQSWSTLQTRLDEAIKQKVVDEETLNFAHQVATRVGIVAERFMELYEEADAAAAALQQDFANLAINEPSFSQKNAVPSVTITSDKMHTLPRYIAPAYDWLLGNLHNPYPSKETKIVIAERTGCLPKDIDNWFISVRKRIGWNTLRMKHYENKRSKIVNAATRFFKNAAQTSDISGIDTRAKHDSEFKAIEKRAKELYSEKLFETPLAMKFDGVVRDLMPKMKVPEECHRQVTKSRGGKDPQRLSAYPSPEPSPDRSPEPLAASPLPVPDATPATSRKRRSSDRDSPELDVEDRCDEPQKRSRLDSYHFSRDLAVASLPSPAASLSDITRDSSATPSDQGLLENDCIVPPTLPIPAAPSGKRKRRLSDAGHDGPSKRPHNALAVPRLQTVSDPLPLANPIINDLYKTMFGQTIGDTIPGPVSVESLDDAQVEVDFYNYDTSPDIMQSFLLAVPPLNLYPCASSLLSTANSEPLSLEKSQVSDPNLDFLFENYLNTPPPQATDTPFFADIPSHSHSTLFPIEDMFPTQPPQEDILSDPYFQIPGLWDFQGNDDTFHNIVPSIGTLFSSNPVPPQIDSTQNEKEAKRKQIEALRAQLQCLEAEP